MQENHYYPYGMMIEGLSNSGTGLPQNMYRYTDKEAQNDLNQNLLDFGWRQYDPVIARWHVTDPAEQFYNPYFAISGNPVSIIDPDGRKGTKPPWEADNSNDGTLSSELNGFGGGAGGGGMGIGSLASLNPYDMQQLQLANGTAIMSYTDGNNWNGNWHMSAGTAGSPGRGGGVIFSNTGSGAAVAAIQGANTNYGVVNGQLVDLNLTYTTQKDVTGFTEISNDGFFKAEIYPQYITQVHYTSVQQDGMYIFQSNFPQKDFRSLNNAERTAHILSAIRYANVNKHYAFNINQIFSNFDKNASNMMGQGFVSGTVSLNFGDRVIEVYVAIPVLGKLSGYYNPLVTVVGGQPFDRNIRGKDWVFYSRPGFQWGTTRENYDYLNNWLGY